MTPEQQSRTVSFGGRFTVEHVPTERPVLADRTPVTCLLCETNFTVWHPLGINNTMWTSGDPYICIRCTQETNS